MQKVIAVAPLYQESQDKLETLYDVRRLYDDDHDRLSTDWIEGCKVVVTNSGCGVGADILKTLPNVQLVANFGTGVDKIDLDYCRVHDIAVTHTPDVLTEDVAHLALGLMLSTVRRLSAADRYVRAGLWSKGKYRLTRSLRNMRVGILGLGRIGTAVAKLCEPFGCTIGYSGPNRKSVGYDFFQTCPELAEWADILVITCMGGEATAGMVSETVLRKLGQDGYVINVSRGSVIDEQALVKCLREKVIAGAGLDVFSSEPHVPEILLTMDNVVLLPHIGSATHDSRRAMGECTLANIAAYFTGNPLPNIFRT